MPGFRAAAVLEKEVLVRLATGANMVSFHVFIEVLQVPARSYRIQGSVLIQMERADQPRGCI